MTTPTEPDRWWEKLFAEHDGKAYNRSHWSTTNTLGGRPALIVVDVVHSFTGSPGLTLEQAAAEYPTACGPAAWAAIPHVRKAVDLFSGEGWPIVYTVTMAGAAPLYGGTVKSELTGLGDVMKHPDARAIPHEVEPPEDALVLAKPKASAFFDTPLLSYFIRRNVDSVVVTGSTTSGCVRATVIDAHSHGYPTFVVEEAVFDRSRLSHGVNLFEMNAKYADVIGIDRLAELTASR
ncbi:isochorismatase family protein [Streptomyces sp. NPDC057199]|uniref:isochorismatase family protein n=1 Tax=Streptomyces sp. NPDC057199 TaxID=3346047 RepID=UPI00363B0D8E